METIKEIPIEPISQDDIKKYNKPSKKGYRFSLEKLEYYLDKSYNDFLSINNEATKTALYKTIYDLAFAILKVGKFNIDKSNNSIKEKAHDYAVYLFERIVSGSFVPQFDDKMPWQQYININIRHLVYPRKSKYDDCVELVDDLDMFLNSKTEEEDYNEEESESLKIVDKFYISKQFLKSLSLYYSAEEIERKLPIALNYIKINSQMHLKTQFPEDVIDFSTVLISIAKRLSKQNNQLILGKINKKDLKGALVSAIRSTTFLSTVVSTDFFPRELLASLDIDSLYRLVLVAGGNKIKIPTKKDLDSLVGASSVISDIILKGGSSKEAETKKMIKSIKNEMNLSFSHKISMFDFINNAIEVTNTFDADKPTNSILDLTNTIFDSLNVVFEDLFKDVTLEDEGCNLIHDTIKGFEEKLINMRKSLYLR